MGCAPSKVSTINFNVRDQYASYQKLNNLKQFDTKKWSLLIYKSIDRESSKVPLKLRLIVLYNFFYNSMIHKRILKFFVSNALAKEFVSQDWAEIVGSFSDRTCIGGSDVDFKQAVFEVYTAPDKIPPWQKFGNVVFIDERVPPGCCWLRVCDTEFEAISDNKNRLQWYLHNGDKSKEIPVKCKAKTVDGHTHYPYKSNLDKTVCYLPAQVEHHDGNIYISQSAISNYIHKVQGLTVSKSLNNLLPKWSPHGPAFTQTYFGCFQIDIVYSYRCRDSWPSSANKWERRPRHHNWPTKEMIQDIVTSGFDIVPIPSKITLTPEADLEWRLSFSEAEKKLVLSFNDCQRSCFIALKIIVKEYVEPMFPDEDFLSSYIMKTLMFWMIEETEQSLWQPEQLVYCLQLCLIRLVEWLQDGFCPSYFIPSYNLFRTKLRRMFVLGFRERFIKCIQEHSWKLLLFCRTFRELDS